MKTTKLLLGAFLALNFGLWTACSKSDKPVDTGGGDSGTEGKFIIAATPAATQGVADYLLTTDNLDQGTLSTKNNGVEQDGTWRYYTTSGNLFFSMLYGQGNPGAVTAYKLDAAGALQKVTNFQTETVQAFAPVDKDILLMKIARSASNDISHWYKVNTETLQLNGEGEINTRALAGNGELAHFSWLTQVGNKVFAPYFSIKADGVDGFGTKYPDSSWIAVFNYPDMSLNTVIRDNRTSFIGAYFTNGLEVDEKGDVYAYASPNATSNGVITSTTPCAFMRINSGTTQYDKSYFFNISEKSGASYISFKLYLGNGAFLLGMTDPENPASGSTDRFAIANVYNQTFAWVTGTPDPAKITSVSELNSYSPKDGKTGYVGITTSDGKSAVYKFDAASATASKGLEVEGGTITAIRWLPSKA
ncbi:protein of unknown function [Arachidicoccus rhizosphaerae]|uniref:DUF4374 domain-containing protein n=1 Tax=Arachidicoccus rhizosphaerae TaxID=551991 RepID=A0A1H3XSX3_9BACT|nr:DUF4374 domain-containing protein [Arachidicoccus rhizosphaerae]SEA02001.1 protein of unknown function [Arachidicoccus rhizosphaerae]